jgi:tetratricopeptide (TPR) repeat protein
MPNWSDKSLKRFQELVRGEPGNLSGLTGLAWAHFQRGNTVDAMAWLGKALAVDGNAPRLHLLRGRIAFDAGRMDKAREWYEKYLASGNDEMTCRLHLARIVEAADDYAGARKHYEAAKACFPLYAGPGNPWSEVSRLKRGEGDLDGAMKELEGLAKLRSTDMEIRTELASWYESKGDWKQVAEILGQVVQIYPLHKPSVMPVHVRLARARMRLADLAGSALEFEVALALGVPEGDVAPVRTELGEVYFLSGQLRDARFQAEAALEIAPDFAPARELLEKIVDR